jgi:hypothetical protein
MAGIILSLLMIACAAHNSEIKGEWTNVTDDSSFTW